MKKFIAYFSFCFILSLLGIGTLSTSAQIRNGKRWYEKWVNNEEQTQSQPSEQKAAKATRPTDLKQIEFLAAYGNVEAMMHLGQLALNDNNIKKAREWYEKAAKAGNAEAQQVLMQINNEQFSGVTLNSENLEEQAKKGNVQAMIMLADKLWKSRDEKRKAVKWYEKAVKAGSTEAKYKLAEAYIEGYPNWADTETIYNKKEAAKLLFEAAEAGNVDAQYKLSELYGGNGLSGISRSFGHLGEREDYIKPNSEESKRWLKIAADNGHKEALSRYLQNASPDEIAKYSEKFALNGNKSAALLVVTHNIDKGNFQKAKEFLQYVDNNDTKVLNIIADAFYKKYQTVDALEFYIKAAKLGDIKSCNKLGEIYAARNQNDDSQKSFEYYMKAAKADDKNAALTIGDYYKNGYGVEKSIDQAKYWYEIADKLGHYKAKESLEKIGFKKVNLNSYLQFVKENEKEGLFNTITKKYVVPLGKYYWVGEKMVGSLIRVWDKNKNIGAIDTDGKLVIPIQYESIQSVQNGAFIEVKTKSGKTGAYTSYGKLLIPVGKYTKIGYMSGGNISVYNGKKVGVVDGKTGQLLVTPAYDLYFCFSRVNWNMMFIAGKNYYIFSSTGRKIASGPIPTNEYRLIDLYKRYMGTAYVTYTEEGGNFLFH